MGGNKASTRVDAAIGATGATGGIVIDAAVGATGAVSDEVRATDGATVRAEGTSDAATAAAEALAAGGAGEGAGAHRIVEVVDGLAMREVPLADRASDAMQAEGERRIGDAVRPSTSALDDVARGRYPSPTFEKVRIAGAGRITTRPGRDAMLPLAEPKLDPALVLGTKVATAAAQVRRGGRSYAPGEKFPIDYKAHTELVPIGAIVAEPWGDMDDHEG